MAVMTLMTLTTVHPAGPPSLPKAILFAVLWAMAVMTFMAVPPGGTIRKVHVPKTNFYLVFWPHGGHDAYGG